VGYNSVADSAGLSPFV